MSIAVFPLRGDSSIFGSHLPLHSWLLEAFCSFHVSAAVCMSDVCWPPRCLCMLLYVWIRGARELIPSPGQAARFHGAFRCAVDGGKWNEQRMTGITLVKSMGVFGGNNCQENGRQKKSGESSGLFIDSACRSVSRRGWKVQMSYCELQDLLSRF